VDIEERNALVARTIQELARDRRTIAFCVTWGTRRTSAGPSAPSACARPRCTARCPSEARAKVLRDFAEGRVQVVTNVAVLTEGFDDPGVSCVAMARPTRSAGTYAQCVGRGTRLAEGKRDCLVLDFVDVSELSLCSLPSLFGMPGDGPRGRGGARGAGDLRAHRVRSPCVRGRGGGHHPGGDPARARRPSTRSPQEVHEDVRAISANAWESLGRHGLALHFEGAPGRLHEALVRPGARGASAGR
jgi:ATP-dependent helicase IRC3